MGEVVNVLVAFAVIIFLFRWITSGSNTNGQSRQRSPAEILGFRPKNVTQEMITTISSMFPDVPAENIRYDLLRSGSVELTTNKILERGYLENPPAAYYTLYPLTGAPAVALRPPAQLASEKRPAKNNLISRFQLEQRISTGEAEKISGEEVGGKAAWEDTAEKREASLRERKAKMILAARQRLLAQQQQKAASNSPGSSTATQS